MRVSVVLHAVVQVFALHVRTTSSALPVSLRGVNTAAGDNALGYRGQQLHDVSAHGQGLDPDSETGSSRSNSDHPYRHSRRRSSGPYRWNHHDTSPSKRRGAGGLGGRGGLLGGLSDSVGLNSRQHRWATAAFNFVHSLDCADVFFTTTRECEALVAVPKHEMNVHIASPSPYGKYRTVIPEEPLTASGLHEAVLVVDPYPRANFGHLVVVFFIDSDVSRGHCQAMGGVYLDDEECMYLALRRRCRNALERLSRRRNYARRCEINFLPVVHLSIRSSDVLLPAVSHYPNPHHHHKQQQQQQQHHQRRRHHHRQKTSSSSSSSPSSSSSYKLVDDRTITARDEDWRGSEVEDEGKNQLSCWSELAGFAQCPVLRPDNETNRVLCDHLRDNTRRCSTTHETVRTSCRMFEVCDQAVLVSGGWNRQTTGPRHLDNVALMYSMLRRNGFKRRNVKIFFANGAKPIKVGREPPQKVYPAALKLALRNHIRRLCVTPHCAESLFIYLNSPTRSDGSALLWDVDGDGLAQDRERYTVRELKEDLANCAARHVTLVADQSFSGELVHALRHSQAHSNVVVFSSGKSGEYSFDDELTRFWASANHTDTCSAEVHAASRQAVKQSNPRMGEGEEDRIRTTIFGAPCNVRPPFSNRELRHNYYGCQNLPTGVWLRDILRASSSSGGADSGLLPHQRWNNKKNNNNDDDGDNGDDEDYDDD